VFLVVGVFFPEGFCQEFFLLQYLQMERCHHIKHENQMQIIEKSGQQAQIH